MTDDELKAFLDRVDEAAHSFPYYTLDDARNVVRCSPGDYLAGKIAQAQGGPYNDPWRVGFDHVGNVNVSTVFLGIDMNHARVLDEKLPTMCFETMIFGPLRSEVYDRYSTWKEARFGHAAAVARESGE